MVSDLGRKDVEEKIADQPVIDCNCFDPRTSKVFQYLIKKELKYLGKMPKVMVEDSVFNMETLLAQVESCDLKRKKSPKPKTERNEFMSKCMTSEQKGGMGKSMGECSDLFKGDKNGDLERQRTDEEREDQG